ncbi:MAG TPA: hypothetical protein VHK06_01015, partial [Candidatus Limnocylindria bacterium]|nr:hypothetical protein [Candidatus Limnocylindria bacterium]
MRGAHGISGLVLGAGLLLAACGSGAGTIPPSTPGSVASQTPPSASARPTTAASTPSPSPTPTPRPSAPETPGPIALAWEALPVEGGPAAREDHTWTVD